MSTPRTTKKLISLAIVALLFFSPALLQGCDSMMSANDADSIIDMAPQDKFRHAAQMDRVTKRPGAGKDENLTGLIFAIEPQKVLDRYKILDRYKVLDRYKILDRYEYEHTFNGFAIWADAAEYAVLVAEMELDPDIAWIEPDIYLGRYVAPADSESTAYGQFIPWGTDRIGATGQTAPDVDLYIIDTGVSNDDVNLVESIDFREDGNDDDDEDGHGTHIAGLAAAINNEEGILGVAAGGKVHSLKVLNGDESDTTDEVELATVIAAVEYVTGEKLANPNKPMVVNLSLGADIGTTKYNALDEAIAASIASGVTYVISAGNQGIDASTVTPAHVEEAITVGAYNNGNVYRNYSNYGPLVDIMAPGHSLVSLRSDKIKGEGLIKMSGTSMAAGYVSGAAMLVLNENPLASPDMVRKTLQQNALPNVKNVPDGTTNLTVYLGTESAPLTTETHQMLHYALTAHDEISIEGALRVTADQQPGVNASIFSNKKLKMEDNNVHVEGFGYSTAKLEGSISVFQPAYNPTNLPAFQEVDDIELPEFDARDYEDKATKYTKGQLKLSGHIQLGTEEEPMIWYVNAPLRTKKDITYSGYGVIIVRGDVTFKHNMIATDVAKSALAIYADGSITIEEESTLELTGHLLATDDVKVKGCLTQYGSIMSERSIKFENDCDNVIHYRAPSALLTDLLRPTGN